ncbi:MAG TPA: hypothetical protein ENN66_08435 [Proteobacteria bacterium]|nr:hypothetical protein [Pseudomonadota bacterium]
MFECSKTVLDAIDLGMEAERQASEFYAEAALKVGAGPAKALFTQLAEFEAAHLAALQALKTSLEGEQCYITYESSLLEPVGVEGSSKLDDAVRKDLLEILNYGIKNEKNAAQAYRDLAAEIEDPNGIAMFEQMAREEDQHARILSDQLYDVKNKGEIVWGD